MDRWKTAFCKTLKTRESRSNLWIITQIASKNRAGKLLDRSDWRTDGRGCAFLVIGRNFQTHACRYSGCTRATLRNSLACVSGHCISHQLMGTIWAPGIQKNRVKKNTSRLHYSPTINCFTANRLVNQTFWYLGTIIILQKAVVV